MSLSYSLISQFAKITNDNNENKKEIITYGTIVKDNNSDYVKIDGSDLLTPYSSTVALKNGDRVVVSIKNHSVIVTGSTTNPAASDMDLQETNSKVSKFNIIVADKITTHDLEVINGIFTNIESVTGKYQDLQTTTAEIEELHAEYADMGLINATDVESINARIDIINSKILESQMITTEDLNAVNAEFNNLTTYNANFTYLSTEKLKAVNAEIDDLKTNKLSAEQADIRYANIDFTNIQIGAIRQLFSESGIIRDIIVQEGKITGELVGVTLKGDLIEGNTIKADKLVVKGEDGVYYKLNIDGLDNVSTSQASKFTLLTEEPENWETNYKDYYVITEDSYTHITDDTTPVWQTDMYYKLNSNYETGLDGTVIVAHSITADKIAVTDLVAFDATIGGFNLTQNSIYSGGKSTVNNTSRGIYMDDTGQIAFGDSNNYIKFFKDTDNQYKIIIQANEIYTSSSSKSIIEQMEELAENTTCSLVIESSRGTVFKSNQASTILSVVIYRGKDRITNITDLRAAMGNNVYLQWKWRRINDNDWGVISGSDSHISEQGFKYTITPADIDNQVSYMCELINT